MFERSLILAALALLTGGASSPASQHAAAPQLLEDVRILSADDMAGRLVDTPGSAKARAYIVERLRTIGVEPLGAAFEQPFTAERREGPYTGTNLIARVRGTGKSDRVLVIGAHYDHLGTRDGHVFNGADDNASGVAALLAIAQALVRERPEHDVILAFWAAEERGLQGAKAFVAKPPVPLSRIAMNLNLDMVARGDKGELWLAGASHSPFLKPRFERLVKAAPVTLKLGHDAPPWTGSDDWTNGSDHRVFYEAGIPFAYFGVEDHPDYHKATDDFDRIPQDFFTRAAATTLQAARLFDAELDDIAKEAGRTR
jgi:Zn-dependent M28 family amino/carboxypeptidase